MANRLLTINIRDYLIKTPRRKRHMRLSNYIKMRIAKSTNVSADSIKISQDLNSQIMTKYLKSMHKLKLNISIEKDRTLVTAFSDRPAAKPATDAKATTAASAAKASSAKAGAAAATQQAPKKDTIKTDANKEVKN